jgi:hypothetical protein
MNLSLLVPLALLFVAACGGEVASTTAGATSDDDGGTSILSRSQTAGDSGSSTNIASSGGLVADAESDTAAAPSSVENASGPGTPVRAGCRRSASLDDAGPGVHACTAWNALLVCSSPTGRACNARGTPPLIEICSSDALTSCPDCSPPPEGTTCTNQCAPNEYALDCGGPPPIPLPDGSVPVVIYQEPPAACRAAAIDFEGQSLCCPCE